jgi:hypothetical protein
MGVSTAILTPLRSSTAAFSTPPVINVKTEPGLDNVIDLSDSSSEDVPVHKVVVDDSTHLFLFSSYVTPSPSSSVPSTHSVPTSIPTQPIVQCLHRLVSMPGSKNVLKKINYDKIKIQEVNHLPLVLMAPSYLSSLQQKSLPLNPGPSLWTAWISNMMAMLGLRLKPPTLQTTMALHFVPLPVLAISNVKTLIVITFNAPIVPLRSMTQNL